MLCTHSRQPWLPVKSPEPAKGRVTRLSSVRRGRDMSGDVPLRAGMSFSVFISHHQCLFQQEAAQRIPPAPVGAAS